MHPTVPHRPRPAVPRPRRRARAGLALAALVSGWLGAPAPAPALADGPGLPGTAAASGAWAVLSGGDLRGTLEAWARGAGWTVVWDSPLNYRLRASARYDGGFEQAVAGLIDAIHLSNPELRVTMYRGNRVLHVETALVETR